MQEPKPFSAESERLYDEYLRSGARGSWQQWLSAHEDRLPGAPVPAPQRELADAAALDRIQQILRDPEWGVGMLEDIAALVKVTGRSVEDYPDGRPTWERH